MAINNVEINIKVKDVRIQNAIVLHSKIRQAIIEAVNDKQASEFEVETKHEGIIIRTSYGNK